MSTEFVLDCSATLPWIFASEATTATDRLLDQLSAGAKAWVPSLWHLELGNVLLGAQRHGRMDRAGIEKFFSTLRKGLPLASLDGQLRAAMKKAGGNLVL
jgi:predicted nucleic acid-binding protein